MGFRNSPPGEQRGYSLPNTRPLNVNTAGFNTNSFVMRAAKIGSQSSSAAPSTRRSNVSQQSGTRKFSS